MGPMVDQQQPDEALMLAYGSGHTAAFESLYARHSQRLGRQVNRFDLRCPELHGSHHGEAT